jgi:predicted N-formylglutamate amidohydrolase
VHESHSRQARRIPCGAEDWDLDSLPFANVGRDRCLAETLHDLFPSMIVLDASLLAADEPTPWHIERPEGPSPWFLICDHAGTRIPRRLGTLGLNPTALASHIAWDIGAAAVACGLGAALNATVILQPYSRLVIDCNRPPHSIDAIISLSESTTIPGNLAVSPTEAAAREQEIFVPYHTRICELLDERLQRGQPTLIIALHSFTPVYLGVARPWQVGVLYNRDARLAHVLAQALIAEGDLVVGDNEPYAVGDETDYAIPRHGEARGLAHVELEIRQDLIADAAGQTAWIQRLTRLLGSIERTLVI